MKKEEPILNYDAYYRKSSEAEDKQVQSIDDQRKEINEYATKSNLKIIGEFEESQSAHQLGRPVFNNIIKRIEKGVTNALLVWHPNRISRNPLDGAVIINLLDEGKLLQVKTPTYTYTNTSMNKMMLAFEFMISKKDSDDKSESVKRGIRGKNRKGVPNGVASIGYLNDTSGKKGDRKWKIDKDRFQIVKQILEKHLTGKYSIRQITRMANEEMGLRTPLREKQGGKKLTVSYMGDTLLRNPIYAGFFFDTDEERHEAHEGITRMITEAEYWRIQEILGNRGRARSSVNAGSYAYDESVRCGNCDGPTTAEHKYQLICSKCKYKFAYRNKKICPKCGILIDDMDGPKYLHYIYYHCCNKHNKKISCRKNVTEVCIDNYLASYFKENLKISKSLKEWCVEHIGDLEENDKQNEYERKASLERILAKKESELKELTMMKVRGLIEDDKEYLNIKDTLKAEIEAVRQEAKGYSHLDPERLQEAYKAFDHATGLEEIFKNGTPDEKKTILLEIGSNLRIKDKTVSIINNKLYSTLVNGLLTAKTKNTQFEPENVVDTSSRNEVFEDVRPTLLRG